jgi:hypothetical protein
VRWEDCATVGRFTKRIVAAAGIFVIGASGSGCSTSSGYCQHRVNDAMDIFTCSVGTGVGAKMQVGPLQTGLFTNTERAGLRGGVIDKWLSRDPFHFLSEEDVLILRSSCFFPDNAIVKARKKSFQTAGIGPLNLPFEIEIIPPKETDSRRKGHLRPVYTQVEAAIAFGASLRVGVNFGEALDFIVGLVGVDIYSDDIASGTVGTGSEHHEPATEQQAAGEEDP